MPLERDLENGKPWVFDQDVADNFDDMLDRSIPDYKQMRALVTEVAVDQARLTPSVVDLGCSRGGALAPIVAALPGEKYPRFCGVEVSEPMRAAAAARFAGDPRVEIVGDDLRTTYPAGCWGVTLSVLTLQFTPIEHRLRILRTAWKQAPLGGVIVLVEKVLGSTAESDEMLVRLHHARKEAAGYSRDEIDRKRLSLEGVLVPVTARWNEDALRSAGWDDVECFWRSLNFAGWVARRST